jgi:hypothetical protein
MINIFKTREGFFFFFDGEFDLDVGGDESEKE